MTLSQTAVLTKKIIILTVATLFLATVGFIGYKIWYAYYLSTLPVVEEKPDIKFGSLPAPNFPKVSVSSSNYSYSLDTQTGGLPKVGEDLGFEKIIKVYFITKSFASLLSADRSQALAEKFGIFSAPQILTETQYQFNSGNEQSSSANKSLLVDLDTGNFSYIKEASISATKALDDDNKLVSDFERFLNLIGYLKEDLKTGRTKVILLKQDNGQLSTTTLRSEAVGALISLWPAPLDKKSIFTPDFNRALVNATVLTSAQNLEDYLFINFTYYPIDATTFGTYPTKTAEEAFDDLKNGLGVVVVEPLKPQVSISSVYLGYYLPEVYSPFLQPIFVFEGPNFVAYVSAIAR